MTRSTPLEILPSPKTRMQPAGSLQLLEYGQWEQGRTGPGRWESRQQAPGKVGSVALWKEKKAQELLATHASLQIPMALISGMNSSKFSSTVLSNVLEFIKM